MTGGFEELERRLVAWATGRDDIRTLLVVGSRARPEEADEWSDLDVAFTTTTPARYLAGTGWLEEIGEVWVAYVDAHGATRHVLFAGGLDAGIAPLSHRFAQALPMLLKLWAGAGPRVLPAGVWGPVERRLGGLTAYAEKGVRLVVDKDGLGAKLLAALPAAGAPAGLPTAEQFRAVVDEFWFLAVWNAKHLRRGELWAAKTVGVDGGMKSLLVRMIGWRARAEGRAGVSEEGRHLEEWADPAVVEQLGGVFAHYDGDDLWRASFATMDLFRRLATETAERLGLPYDGRADREVTVWVVRCEAERR